MDREAEFADLREADRHIYEAEHRLAKHQALALERPSEQAEQMLRTMRAALETMHTHRRLIIQALEGT